MAAAQGAHSNRIGKYGLSLTPHTAKAAVDYGSARDATYPHARFTSAQAHLNGRASMNQTESRASNTAATTRASRASHRTFWVVVLTLPVTIVALAITLGVFGLLVRLFAA
jgi:hypothetical protein